MNRYYKKYLKSEDWKTRRKILLEEADWVCAQCGGHATMIHHLNYDNLGDEILDEDVIAICKSCHKDVHSQDEIEYEGYEEW